MLLITSLAFVLLLNLGLFCIAYRRSSDKLTDFAYALSFIGVSFATLLLSSNISPLLAVMVGMVVLWGLRLGSFLVIRIRKVGKDTRFNGIREHFFKFLQFWIGQGLVAWVLLLPLLFLAQVDSTFSITAYVGIVIWLIGLSIETIADLQKYRFNQNPANKNKWIESGLWRYSLHPNYFGEILVWVGIYVTALASLSPSQRLVGLMSPLTIFITLRFISGVPPLEKSAMERWGKDPSYRLHRARTNLLLPFWPRRPDPKA